MSRSTDAADSVSRLLSAGALPLTGPLTLLIDYDGTLVPYASTPAEAVPDADLHDLLEAIASDDRIACHIVSGRWVDDLARWFGDLEAELWAEHGALHRAAPGIPWEATGNWDLSWIEEAARFLRRLTAETPYALLEEKQTALAWHYRMVDPALAKDRIAQLRAELPGIIDRTRIDLLEGRLTVELRPRGISKGLAVRHVVNSGRYAGPVIAIGDDRTDEDMFAALPESGTAIRVGGGATRARYELKDFQDVRLLLRRLVAGQELD